MRPLLSLLIALLTVGFAGSAPAITSTWDFTGEITSVVNESGFGFPVATNVGDSFQLRLLVDYSTPDIDLDPDDGDFFGAIESAIFTVSGTDIPLPTAASTIRTILDTSTQVVTGSGSGGLPTWFATIGGSPGLLDGSGIPTTAVDLSLATFAELVLQGDPALSVRPVLRGAFDTFEIHQPSAPVPEPSGALVFGLGVALLGVRLRSNGRR